MSLKFQNKQYFKYSDLVIDLNILFKRTSNQNINIVCKNKNTPIAVSINLKSKQSV